MAESSETLEGRHTKDCCRGSELVTNLWLSEAAICLALVSFRTFAHQRQAILVCALVAYIACFVGSQGAMWIYISEVIAARSGAYPFAFFASLPR